MKLSNWGLVLATVASVNAFSQTSQPAAQTIATPNSQQVGNNPYPAFDCAPGTTTELFCAPIVANGFQSEMQVYFKGCNDGKTEVDMIARGTKRDPTAPMPADKPYTAYDWEIETLLSQGLAQEATPPAYKYLGAPDGSVVTKYSLQNRTSLPHPKEIKDVKVNLMFVLTKYTTIVTETTSAGTHIRLETRAGDPEEVYMSCSISDPSQKSSAK